MKFGSLTREAYKSPSSPSTPAGKKDPVRRQRGFARGVVFHEKNGAESPSNEGKYGPRGGLRVVVVEPLHGRPGGGGRSAMDEHDGSQKSAHLSRLYGYYRGFVESIKS